MPHALELLISVDPLYRCGASIIIALQQKSLALGLTLYVMLVMHCRYGTSGAFTTCVTVVNWLLLACWLGPCPALFSTSTSCVVLHGPYAAAGDGSGWAYAVHSL